MFLNVHYWSRSVWHAVIVIWSPTPTVQLTVIHEGEQLEKCGCVDLSSVKSQAGRPAAERLSHKIAKTILSFRSWFEKIGASVNPCFT